MFEQSFSHPTLNIFASLTSGGRRNDPFLLRLWVGPVFTMKTYRNKQAALSAVEAALSA